MCQERSQIVPGLFQRVSERVQAQACLILEKKKKIYFLVDYESVKKTQKTKIPHHFKRQNMINFGNFT